MYKLWVGGESMGAEMGWLGELWGFGSLCRVLGVTTFVEGET